MIHLVSLVYLVQLENRNNLAGSHAPRVSRPLLADWFSFGLDLKMFAQGKTLALIGGSK